MIQPASAPARVRARGLVVAFLLAPLVAAWLAYGELVLRTTSSSASLVPTVLVVLLLVSGVNALVGRVRPAWKLSPADLVLCYAVLTLAAVLTGFDLLQLLPPGLLFLDYYGARDARFAPLAHALPAWFRPSDPDVVRSFFEGRADLSDPALWRAWALPLTVWTGFVLVLLSTMLCLNVLVREQWLRKERLPFPIIELPLTLCEDEGRKRLFGSRLFWAGFGGTLVVLSVNALSTLYPNVPGVSLNLNNVGRDLPIPWSGAAPLYLSWAPFGIGIAFFVPLDVLFSSWFFFLLRKGLEVAGVVYGWRDAYAGNAPDQFPNVREVAQGAWIGLLIVLLRGGRQHLAHVWRLAFPLRRGEPLNRTYRLALLGLAAGFSLLVSFEWAAGMRPGMAVAYFGIFFLSTLVMTRVFAQIGAPVLELYFFNAENLLLGFIGTRGLQGPETALLGQAYWFNHAYRQHPMGQQLAAMKMADRVGLRLRPLVAALTGAALIGTVVGLVTLLACYHALGAATAKVNGGPLGVGGWETWNRAANWQAAPKGPEAAPLFIMALSALVCLGLGRLGDVWLGSPFRPVGFAFAFSYALDYSWNVFLMVYLFKIALLRYGGLRAYRTATPFFLGMVLGDALAQVFWGLIAALVGIPGVSPYRDPRW